MSKKIIAIGTIIFFLLPIGFTLKNPLLAMEEEEKNAFEQILSAFYNSDEKNPQEMKRVKIQLWNFSKEYPESEFTDDSKIIYIFTWFFGALKNNDIKGIQESIQYMKNAAGRYADGKIEEATIKKLQELGIPSSSFLYIPYKFAVTYMRGLAEGSEALINNFNSFKDKLNYSEDKDGTLALQIYGALGMAYLVLQKYPELEKIKEEANEKFPDNTQLREYMGRLIEIADKDKKKNNAPAPKKTVF